MPPRPPIGLKLALTCALTAVLTLFVLPVAAFAQEVQITPNFSNTPTRETGGWIYWMGQAAVLLGGVVLLGILASYLRFAPRFFGRQEAAKLPPGARPPLLARTREGRAPTGSTRPPVSAAPAGGGVEAPGRPAGAATRPAPHAEGGAPSEPGTAAEDPGQAKPQPDTTPAQNAEPVAGTTQADVLEAAGTQATTEGRVGTETPARTEGEAAAAEASARPTGPPQAEPVAQADAVGQAEAAAPEERPSAKGPDEVDAPEAAAEQPEATAPSDVETPAGDVARVPDAEERREEAPAASGGQSPPASGMDQGTYDRVLKEQLDKGVSQKVAEGRARAAATVAARKRSPA